MLMPDNDNWIAQLAEKGKKGNNASLERLVDHFYGDIFRMVYYRIPSQMDAEDLTQDIFRQMIKSLPNLKDPDKLKPWLFRLALNRIRDFYRKKSILSFFGSTIEIDADAQATEDSHHDPLKNLMQKEFQMQFWQFSKGLPRWEREVFILRFMDNLDIREIAQILKKNENTIKTHLYRALKKFRNNSKLHALLKGDES
jgi:RNA polymerase sigma-70 factor (ECF subfamily)